MDAAIFYSTAYYWKRKEKGWIEKLQRNAPSQDISFKMDRLLWHKISIHKLFDVRLQGFEPSTNATMVVLKEVVER
jgi:hypothetical protein